MTDSAIATAVDYALYMALVTWFWPCGIQNIISYTIAVVINFTLQKKYIFDLQRRVRDCLYFIGFGFLWGTAS
ncbi:MAG: GtrA family protein [Saprospiraceae bacterium]